MRYAGGGIGHYRLTPSDTPANVNETAQEDDLAMDEDIDPPRSVFATTNLEECRIAAETVGREEVEGAGHIFNDNIEDRCLDLEGEEDEDEENPDEDDEDDLGAEDGEGGFVDIEDDEGYAVL